MEFIGYNPRGIRVYENEDEDRILLSKAGSVIAVENKLSPTYCYFNETEDFYNSVYMYALNVKEPVSNEYIKKFHDKCGLSSYAFGTTNQLSENLAASVFSNLRKKSVNGVIKTSDIMAARKAYNNLANFVFQPTDYFDFMVRLCKLTIDFDHCCTQLESKYYGALPPAVISKHSSYGAPSNAEKFLIYSNGHFPNLNWVDSLSNRDHFMVIYLQGVTDECITRVRSFIKNLRTVGKIRVGEDNEDCLLICSTDEAHKESESWSYFGNWNDLFIHYKNTYFSTEEVQIDQDKFYEEFQQHASYKPMSSVTLPFTTLAKPIADATQKALDEFVKTYGPADTYLKNHLPDFEDYLIAEQVDAVCLRDMAMDKGCSFLLADATGVGKGRSLAAMAKVHAKRMPNALVIYFTENAEINVPDVWRDVTATRADELLKPVVITGKRVHFNGLSSLTPKGKTELFESEELPEGKNMILTNYSQLKSKESPFLDYLKEVCKDRDVLVILDEAHNALLPTSNMGKNMRKLLFENPSIKKNGVVFATATPLRDIRGIDLYHNLLMNNMSFSVVKNVLMRSNMSGQEALTTMLAGDGTFLRRDHDLSDIKIEVDLPNQEIEDNYRQLLERFSGVMNKITDLNIKIGQIKRNQIGNVYNNLLNNMDEASARRELRLRLANQNNSTSHFIRLNRLFINAIKIDQVVDSVCREILDDRKPMITFHSTNESAVKTVRDQELPVNFSSLIQVTLDRMVNGWHPGMDEVCDYRVTSQAVHRLYYEIMNDARQFAGLPLSPVDDLIAKLSEKDIKCEEITGRNTKVTNGEIFSRKVPNRREVVDRFNSGEVDVLVYNQAGATGGSFHASSDFKDQRARTIIEMETPVDIIKYVQSQGRGNRYGQLAPPKILSVVTGLIPEMRILQQRNVKLKSLGASTEGSRTSHPLLMADIPDLLNSVGDKAVRMVLDAMPELKRIFGINLNIADDDNDDNYATPGMANKILNYSITLPVDDQVRLFDNIITQFNMLIEELDLANKNPLKLKEIRYPIDIQTENNFTNKLNSRRLVISEGYYKKPNQGVTAYQVYDIVSKADTASLDEQKEQLLYNIRSNRNVLLEPFVPASKTLEQVLNDPAERNASFQNVLNRINGLENFLNTFKIGMVYTTKSESKQQINNCVVGAEFPPVDECFNTFGYRLKVVSTGSLHSKWVNLHFLITGKKVNFSTSYFSSFCSPKANNSVISSWTTLTRRLARTPVQILTGDLMSALDTSIRNGWGSLCLYKTTSGDVKRGVVIEGRQIETVDFPVEINDELFHIMLRKRPSPPEDRRRSTYSYYWPYVSITLENGSILSVEHCRYSGGARLNLRRCRVTPKRWSDFLEDNPVLSKYCNELNLDEMSSEDILKDFGPYRLFCGDRTLKRLLEDESTV